MRYNISTTSINSSALPLESSPRSFKLGKTPAETHAMIMKSGYGKLIRMYKQTKANRYITKIRESQRNAEKPHKSQSEIPMPEINALKQP